MPPKRAAKRVSAGSRQVVAAVEAGKGVTSKLKVGAPTQQVEPERVRTLNDKPEAAGKYVLYWVQAAVRWSYNHALQYGKQEANRLGLPLLCCFGVTPYPEANLRHYRFLLEGVADLQAHLKAEKIRLVVKQMPPSKLAAALATDAALVVTDMGYLRIQRQWRSSLAAALKVRLVQVETCAAVPVETVSSKREFAARTIRPKIMKLLPRFLHRLTPASVAKSSLGLRIRLGGDADLTQRGAIDKFLAGFKGLDRSVPSVSQWFEGGATAAGKQLQEFIDNRLGFYGEHRNDPDKLYSSDLSPYYHYGHVSPVQAAVAVMESAGPKTGKEGFVEESIVRRELSLNFCHFEEKYDDFSCLPSWAQKTLKDHMKDKREHQYTLKQLEDGKTDDEVWNAAQKHMVVTGKMANYMRMYWGKKVLEWAPSHQLAYKWLLYLNNKYELDGRDPNSFAGVAWVFGNHDRPWQKTPAFGMVRYMGQRGMYSKFNMPGYISMVEQYAQGVRKPVVADKKGASAAAKASAKKAPASAGRGRGSAAGVGKRKASGGSAPPMKRARK
uniref:Deoxyribodipyrimidine photo-lyase n=1 Tax=Lingulaulax polyedra TaxID=160621 RepID=A0A516AGA6_LINPO|nr:CPD photolyase [Lingulodinium polyedra]